jgi:hypothetical protein
MEESPLVNSLLQVIRNYDAEWKKEAREKDDRIKKLEEEVVRLQNELVEASIPDEVIDEALKERLARLKSAPLDTIIRETGVVLESRLRAAGNIVDKNLTGVGLVDAVFNSEKGQLIFSDHAGEQEGIKLLYRGATQFVRNPPMHKLIEYQEGMARILIRLMDSLLLLIEEGKPRVDNEVKLESVRLMLKRRPISKGQRELFKTLAGVGEKGMTNSELAQALGMSRPSLAGLFGALGTRITHTQGLTTRDGINVVFDITAADNGEWLYKVRPIFRQALEAEKII